MKYIIFEDKSVILFSETADHKTMAAGRPVYSAGFCDFETVRTRFDDIICGTVSAYGGGTSIGAVSKLGDDRIIKEAIGRMG